MILHSSMIKLCAHTFPSSTSYHMSLIMVRASVTWLGNRVRTSSSVWLWQVLYTLNIYFLFVFRDIYFVWLCTESGKFGPIMCLQQLIFTCSWKCWFTAVQFTCPLWWLFLNCDTGTCILVVCIYFIHFHREHSTVRHETVGIPHSKLGFSHHGSILVIALLPWATKSSSQATMISEKSKFVACTGNVQLMSTSGQLWVPIIIVLVSCINSWWMVNTFKVTSCSWSSTWLQDLK